MNAAKSKEPTPPIAVPLAIVGMACRFPKADDLDAYWANIRDGIDAIDAIPSSHWSTGDYFDADPKKRDHTYGTRGGFLSPLAFDPLEYGIAPNAIEATDTSQLLAMVAARDALIDAGYGDPGRSTRGIGAGGTKALDRDRVSVIVGVTGTLELVIPLGARLGHPLWRRALEEAGVDAETADDVVARIADGYVDWQEASFPGLLGNVVAGRIANRFDLGGTNCVVDAACASSLSALHLAALELESGRSDVVVTGGVDTFNDIFMYMCFSKTPALSPSGHARPFAKDGDGTTLGEGVGIVVLKRLDDAQRDGDRVYAVVRGLGSSSDGKGNAIYAPNADGQAKALRRAYENAAVRPDTIGLVEAHGTGTSVGDATEVRGLTTVFRESTSDGTWCALGSVKSQIGHTKAAAGVAGLIKTALALHHQVLPPTLKVDVPLEELAPDRSPFYVNTRKRPWLAHPEHPRRAALSAFGFGGSNFHCVLEEAVESAVEPDPFDGSIELVALCADSAPHLREALLEWQPAREWSWSSLRRRAAESRRRFDATARCRLVFPIDRRDTNIASMVRGAAALLESKGDAEFWSTPEGVAYGAGSRVPRIAFVFPGQGAQYTGMLRDLACAFPSFRAVLERADVAYWHGEAQSHERRLSDVIYPRHVFPDAPDWAATHADQERALRATDTAQPAIGAVSVGALSLLDAFGVRPDACAGHSYGELPALLAAGRLSEASFHQLSNFRGRLMAAGRGDRGSMIAVSATEEEVRSILRRESIDLVIANRNTPRQVVLSGARHEVERSAAIFERARVRARVLSVSAAFHSSFVADAEAPFREILEKVRFPEGSVPVYANTTAEPYPRNEKDARALLAGQLAHPVEFVDMIRRMRRDGIDTFVEIGPGARLSSMIDAILTDGPSARTFSIDPSSGQRPGVADFARLLGSLAALGRPVELSAWAPSIGAETNASAETPKKKRFTVPITGANVRADRPERPRRERATSPTPPRLGSPVTVRPSSPHRSDATDTRPATPIATLGTAALPGRALSGSPSTKEAIVKSNPYPASEPNPRPAAAASGEALRLLTQSLEALRELQAETAELHRQFLEGQRQAQESFVRLVERQASLADASLGSPSSVAPEATRLSPMETPRRHAPESTPEPRRRLGTRRSSPAPVDPPRRPSVDPSVPTAISSRMSAPVPTTSEALPETRAPVHSTPPAVDATVVLEIVAEKTGYPTEMLELDMELEADLGIDSIKRVEILSAVQERLAHARTVGADELGTLRTLRDVVGILEATESASPSPSVDAPPSEALDTDGFDRALLEVVAEKTGYPTEMLELDMELEADLGIDSIKRVEILSAVQERYPDLPPVAAEELGRLSTLREICAHFAGAVPPAAVPPAPDADGGDELATALLEVVAEKTGYPTEMLELDMELEADLGIDSIKRVEILSAVQERRPDLPVVDAEALGRLRTLSSVLDHFRSHAASSGEGSRAPFDRSVEARDASTAAERRPSGALIRSIPTPKRYDLGEESGRPLRGGTFVVLGPEDPTRRAIEAELRRRTIVVATIAATEYGKRPALPSDLDGVIVVGNETHDMLRFALSLATRSATMLRSRRGVFATVSRLGGRFGFDDSRLASIDGGLAGLAKTARGEWPEVSCRALDLAPEPNAKAIERLVDAVLSDGPEEVGFDDEARAWTIALEERRERELGPLPIGGGDLVVVTGGARGVTAAACLALAEAVSPHFVLIGRSAAPTDEPEFLRRAQTDAELKRALLAEASGRGERLAPRDLGERVSRVLAAREMRSTFDALERHGARVTYVPVDVSDAEAVRTFVASLEQPVRGLIHGAGVLRDRRIEDKTSAEFDAVYGTKVEGFLALLEAISADDLRFCALFSSTTARLGRVGQVDYAMANEVLNKLAYRVRGDHPGAKVVAFGWGPWEGGMVTPALRDLFRAEGVGLIPLDEGAHFFVDELRAVDDAIEVIVLGPGPGDEPTGTDDSPRSTTTKRPLSAHDRSLRTARRFGVGRASHPYLEDHRLGGLPVVPAAMMVEWLAEAVREAGGATEILAIEAFRVLRGIRVDDDVEIEVAIGDASRSEIPCE
ncbi:MAG: acyltransferase domain-containing protein, partial [Planctomycetes bacterium]|nr:acyltransferase domain-containing protein [Planctomycetota bacterium]